MIGVLKNCTSQEAFYAAFAGNTSFFRVLVRLFAAGQRDSFVPFYNPWSPYFMVKKVKVLLVDDELPSLSKMYIDLLLKNYEVEATHEAREVMPRIRRFRPDVVIIPPALPGLDAHDLCCAAKELGLCFILMVNEPGEMPYKIGSCTAADTLLRPVDLCLLEQKIGGVLV